MSLASAKPRPAFVLPGVTFVSSFLLRLGLIWAVPSNYSFDAYQRWAGREEWLIRDWLPLMQSVLVLNSGAGGDIISARIVLALVASIGMAMGALLVRRLGGESAGWCFAALCFFGPALCWTVVPYQEGCYWALLTSGLYLSFRAREDPSLGRHRWMADLMMGALALCRTEGWPLVLLYVSWWRDRRSLRALWGIGLWSVWKWVIGQERHYPSPVDYADWEGLGTRVSWDVYQNSLLRHLWHWFDSGGWVLALGGVAGLWLLVGRRTRESEPATRWTASLVATALCLQCASTLAWMAGLETATVRMTVLPGLMLAIFAAVAFGRLMVNDSLPWVRPIVMLFLTGVSLYFVLYGWSAAHRSSRSVRWERVLTLRMEQCTDCYFQIEPRSGIGTRSRHDGCEILLGIGDWQHPEDFHCATWPEDPLRSPTHRAEWTGQGYSQVEIGSR